MTIALDDLEAQAAALLKRLVEKGLRVATAESCTGGLIAQLLTSVPGSSRVYERGFVTYSNEAKIELLGVDPAIIETDGAVSDSCARAMARGAFRASRADLALSVTGVAGPDGGSPQKPVGTVWLALAGQSGVRAHAFAFPGDRRAVRHAAAAAGLRLFEAAAAASE